MKDKNLNPEVPPETKIETPEKAPVEVPKEEEKPQVPDNPKFEDIDKIDDVEALRKIAKDQYATRIRLGKKLDKAPDSKPIDSTDALTKRDFHKINEKEAIEQATTILDTDSEELKEIKKDLNEHWDDIKKHYSGKSGKDRVKDIADDIFDAHAAWKRRGGGKAPDNAAKTAAELARNAGKGGGGKPTSSVNEPKSTLPPRPTPMTEWYKKP